MKHKYELLRNKYDIENSRLSGLTNLYDAKLKELTKNERELRYKAKLDAENILKNANKLIEKTIKELREKENLHKEIKKEFAQEAAEIIKPEPEELSESNYNATTAEVGEIRLNDFVRILNTNSTGEVIQISGNAVTVNINGIAIKTTPDELEKINKPDTKDKYRSDTSYTELNTGSVSTSLDLRGKYTYEINNSLYTFLDEALRNGLREVSVIHGKGSGKLRDEVHKQLKENVMVKSFRLGSISEGDSGVTLVKL